MDKGIGLPLAINAKVLRMPDYVKLAAEGYRKQQIYQFAPECCRAYRTRTGMSQAALGRMLGTNGPVVSSLENGRVRSWIVAEAVIILNGEDMALLRIEETPGLRDRLKMAFEMNAPINMLPVA